MSEELEEAIKYFEKISKEWKKLGNIQKEAAKKLEIILQALKNSIPKEAIETAIKEIKRSRDLSNMCIEKKIIIADSDSLYEGQEIAHNADINILKKLLEEKRNGRN